MGTRFDDATASMADMGVLSARSRRAPLTGFGFVLFFVASVLASNPPSNSAPNADWVARYADRAHQVQPFATGLLLVAAGLCLMTFLTTLWTRIAAAGRPTAVSPVPIVAAGVSAACIAVGGVVMAAIAGAMLFGSARVPAADLLRYSNDLGFGLVSVGGMWAAAVSIAWLSVQARSVGLFGAGLSRFGLVVAALLLASVLFLPIVALLAWLIVVSIVMMRGRAAVVRPLDVSTSPAG